MMIHAAELYCRSAARSPSYSPFIAVLLLERYRQRDRTFLFGVLPDVIPSLESLGNTANSP